METRADVFTSARPMLFAIAYRMLGSVMDAEDLVQEAYLRWEQAADTEVRSPRAYLTTIVTRLAINQLRAARTKRETYVGPWLPEPLVTENTPDTVELAESLSMAFLVLLERLAPVERAAFLLHEVFDFEYAEIARVLDKTEANCRQLVARARGRASCSGPGSARELTIGSSRRTGRQHCTRHQQVEADAAPRVPVRRVPRAGAVEMKRDVPDGVHRPAEGEQGGGLAKAEPGRGTVQEQADRFQRERPRAGSAD
jgi:RNA polymerase sigma factor (sigma-70 family)